MQESMVSLPELPNFIGLIAEKCQGSPFSQFLLHWENIIYSISISFFIIAAVYFGTRKLKVVPERYQNFLEAVFGGIDDFVCSVLGKNGRRYVPFLGTLFIYIIVMNLAGLVPFFKSPTASWSTTMALALCVFIYAQYTAFKELGFFGYFDHLMGSPRGGLAWSVILPATMLVIHMIAELVRPLSLSLRLRTNIWGEDLLLAMTASLGLKGLPLYFFMTLLSLMTAVVQAMVFGLLATVYLALVQKHEEAH
jgi:F-type H+-transporting ATPase subunit a